MADPTMTATLADNIETLTRRARADAAAAPLGDRIAARITLFTGSMTFVALHAVVFGGWLIWNLGWIPGLAPFDPTFVVLAMEASVEAIFLSTFVLIAQNRLADAADRRADLDLHISLLAEHELTRVAQLLERIAGRLDVPTHDLELAEVGRDVAPEAVLDAIDAKRG